MSIPQLTIEPLIPADSDWVKRFTITHWYADIVVIHGQEFAPHSLPGFVAMLDNERIGLATYHIDDGDGEIITLNSLRDGMGVGTALIEAVKTAAQQGGCTRLWLVTTNDNLQALGFYQKRGFVLVADTITRRSRRGIAPQVGLRQRFTTWIGADEFEDETSEGATFCRCTSSSRC